MSDNNSEPGRDLESRASLYRVVQLGAALDTALRGLTPEAAARIGATDETLDAVGGVRHIVSRALWASTSDLHQRGEDEFARRVIGRAAEIARGGAIVSETMQELTPDTPRDRWLVTHLGGSRTIWILDHNRTEFMRQPDTGAAMPGDDVLYGIRHILAWPKIGYHSRVELRNGTRHTTTEVTAIRPLVLPDDMREATP